MTVSTFDTLQDLLIDLLEQLSNDTRCEWSSPQLAFLQQRFCDIHETMEWQFAAIGLQSPRLVADQLSRQLFREFFELLAEIQDDCDDWPDPAHRSALILELKTVHERFEQSLNETVQTLDREALRSRSTQPVEAVRLIDSLFEELYSTTEAPFTLEHVDFLERRFFEIREAIEALPLNPSPVSLHEVAETIDDCVRHLADYDEHNGEEGALYRRCIRLLSQLNTLSKGEHP